MKFKYLNDPLFVSCFTLYWTNRLIIKNIPHHSFFDNYLNDLICIPMLVPIMLFAARKLKLRAHDEPPFLHEVLIPIFVWSIFFEIIFPQNPAWAKFSTSDPFDVIFYTVGGCIALNLWQLAYCSSSPKINIVGGTGS